MTELMLSHRHKLVIYVDKRGDRHEYALQNSWESKNIEMTKRLSYLQFMHENIIDMSKKRVPQTARVGVPDDQ